jgi:hypothetical protein
VWLFLSELGRWNVVAGVRELAASDHPAARMREFIDEMLPRALAGTLPQALGPQDVLAMSHAWLIAWAVTWEIYARLASAPQA